VTLTTDVGKIMAAIASVSIRGQANPLKSLQMASLVLKHRQMKEHRQRIVLFVASPIHASERELVTLGRKLRKANIALDVINFGEDMVNMDLLNALTNAVSHDGNSHILHVPAQTGFLSDVVLSSAICASSSSSNADANAAGPTGGNSVFGGNPEFEFGFDPESDPELAMVLRLSMQEAQEREAREAASGTNPQSGANEVALSPALNNDDMEIDTANALFTSNDSIDDAVALNTGMMDQDMDDDDEEMAKAIALSLAGEDASASHNDSNNESTSQQQTSNPSVSEDLAAVLASLPGVDPGDSRILTALTDLAGKKDGEHGEKDSEEEQNDKDKSS